MSINHTYFGVKFNDKNETSTSMSVAVVVENIDHCQR